MIQSSVYARAGIAGNPSDGFYGKTVAACVRNWWATVSLEESDCIEVVPNPEMDPFRFSSWDKLLNHADRYGYYGALRLIHATCARFYRSLPVVTTRRHGYRIEYCSNIPRQVGLGGSSALVVALLNCLFRYHQVDMPLPKRAHLAWAVENEELGIHAGFQDRVVQTYGGLVYMDFNRELIEQRGYGEYEKLDAELPRAFIMYTEKPRKNSGQVHESIRERWERNDLVIKYAMNKFSWLAERMRRALVEGDIAEIIRENWRLRIDLYGKAISQENYDMVGIANSYNCPAKLPGSGGGILGLYSNDTIYFDLKIEAERQGFQIEKVIWDR